MAEISRRQGGFYRVTPEEVECFRRDGYVHLEGVLSEDEVAGLEETYASFMKGEIEVAGRDFCDMSADYRRPIEEYAVVNVMLPRKYHPALRNNIYERRAAAIAEQLCGPDMTLDYDQLLAKSPFRDDAVFGWHQDLAYWPETPDTRTASFWLAIDDATVENGCIHFLPGSHREPKLRRHRPLHGDRKESHTLVAEIDSEQDRFLPTPISRGDVTVHHERTLHGSPGNSTAGWRRAYVIAFRARETVEAERRQGFTHSHNDKASVLDEVGVGGETRDED